MALLTLDQIATQIINQLKLLDPAVSAEIGTPERKLIEATAELIAGQQVDFTVLNQQTDLSALSGGRLDAYLSVYNFGRKQATPAFGTVIFSRTTPATTAIVVPQGTQVIANLDDTVFPSLTFVTTQTVILATGGTQVSSPVQCTIGGTIGNIDANKIVGFGGLISISGISTVSNSTAFTGGTDQEDDATYIARFKNTFLRNIAGTDDQYLALAVSLNGITKANVVGPISRYQEYVQVPASDDLVPVTPYDPNGVRAFAVLTSDNTEPADGDTVTINNVTYRFKNTIAVANDVHRTGSSADADLLNLIRAVNGTGTPGTDYHTGTQQPTDVTSASSVSSHTVTFSAVTYGTVGNTYPSSETSAHLAFGGPFFSGGVDSIFQHKRTSAQSTIPYSQYTYSANFYLTDGTLNPATAKFFRSGVDFIFNAPAWDGSTGVVFSTPPFQPNVTFLNPYDATFNPSGDTNLAAGNVLLLEHAYISTNSRNNYNYGILNCIDVFINGENPQTVNSEEIVPTDTNNLQNSNSALWTYQNLPGTVNFKRKIDGTPAGTFAGDFSTLYTSRIQPLFWQPVLDVPDSIVVGVDTYYKANYYDSGTQTYYNQYDGTTYSFPAHYIVVEEVTSYFGTLRSRSGIEWFLENNNYLEGQLVGDPSDGSSYSGDLIDSLAGTQFSLIGYSYDRNVADLQAIMEQNKQTTADVLVHKARLRHFRPIVTIMYTIGATQSVVKASIIAALENYFETQYYGTAIQLSDILQVVHNVPGVDNVRYTSTPDTVGWGSTTGALEEVNADGSSFFTPSFITTDFFIQDNELAASPSANEVTITPRAQNTWS